MYTFSIRVYLLPDSENYLKSQNFKNKTKNWTILYPECQNKYALFQLFRSGDVIYNLYRNEVATRYSPCMYVHVKDFIVLHKFNPKVQSSPSCACTIDQKLEVRFLARASMYVLIVISGGSRGSKWAVICVSPVRTRGNTTRN